MLLRLLSAMLVSMVMQPQGPPGVKMNHLDDGPMVSLCLQKHAEIKLDTVNILVESVAMLTL